MAITTYSTAEVVSCFFNSWSIFE